MANLGAAAKNNSLTGKVSHNLLVRCFAVRYRLASKKLKIIISPPSSPTAPSES
jgi:hypothetical protein